MAKQQTRRSISVNRETYERLKAFCETNERSMSGMVEDLLDGFFQQQKRAQAPVDRVGNIWFTF